MVKTMAPINLESRLALAGSEPCWVQLSVWPLATDSGVRYPGVMEDITVRKKTIAHTAQLMRQGRFELRTLDEARHLAELLAYAFPDPSRARLGLTELFVNGVEHGNLNLSYAEKSALLNTGTLDCEIARRLALPDYAQKRVRVSLDRTEAALRISITDEGKGFDWRQYLDLDITQSADGHGRGIAMAKTIGFDELDYRGCGNQVVASTRLGCSGPEVDEGSGSEAA